MNRILIAEDDLTIREGIQNFLIENNFLVDAVGDGAAALEYVRKNIPDLVILDLGLPKISGESVCIEIKKQFPTLPVIILTAKNQTADIVDGFKLGADDYISKPFELDVLMARIGVRLKKETNEKIQIDDLMLDPQAVRVTRNGVDIQLTPHEFKLLHYLLVNRGRVLTREMILNRVWKYSMDVDSRVVDVYIGYLRKKIDGKSTKKLISSVRGFGYLIKE
ncbi:MAG TPA: response regulator transcription factor [Candidatus Saccharimonadales bacterium]|nr:response regulator transcription factor [Candidatus Saccharimonadales bacterium]